MAYPIYPSVDGSNNFPPAVRAAMAASPEVAQVIKTLTNSPDGLFSKGYIPNTESFDMVIVPGLYNYLGSHPSAPTSSAGSLLVGRVGQGLWRNQIIFEHGSSRAIYLRSRQNGSFTNWGRVDGQEANAKNALQDLDIKFVTDRTRTVSSNEPTNSAAPVGVLHYDELAKRLWVKTSQPGTSEWLPIMLESRGRVGAQDIDTWLDAKHNGWWDVMSTLELIAAGSTLPPLMGDQMCLLEQVSTSNRLAFQKLYLIEGGGHLGAVFHRARYGWTAEGAPGGEFGPWRKQGVDGSLGRVSNENIDLWHDTIHDGQYDIWNPTSIQTMVAAGSTIPSEFTSGQLVQMSTTNRMATQFLISSELNNGLIWTRTNTGWKADPTNAKFGPWKTISLGSGTPLDSSLTRTNMIGDSNQKGFDNSNGSWPYADSLAGKLSTIFGEGMEFRNLGVPAGTVDEILVQMGVRRLRIRPTAPIPASETSSVVVDVSRDVVTSAGRLLTWTGTYRGEAVVLKRDSSAVWRISRVTPASQPTPVVGWDDFIPTAAANTADGFIADDPAIALFGGNNASSDIHGTDNTTADHILSGYYDLSRFLSARRANFLFLGVTTRVQDVEGTIRHTTVQEVQEKSKLMFPGHHFDLQRWLREDALDESGVAWTSEDRDLVAAGTVPRSVLAPGDTAHYSKVTVAALANRIEPILRGRSWVDLP